MLRCGSFSGTLADWRYYTLRYALLMLRITLRWGSLVSQPCLPAWSPPSLHLMPCLSASSPFIIAAFAAFCCPFWLFVFLSLCATKGRHQQAMANKQIRRQTTRNKTNKGMKKEQRTEQSGPGRNRTSKICVPARMAMKQCRTHKATGPITSILLLCPVVSCPCLAAWALLLPSLLRCHPFWFISLHDRRLRCTWCLVSPLRLPS